MAQRLMALPVIDGDAAKDAIHGMMREHPHLAHHIERLAAEFLRRARGLRDGLDGRSRTYDLGFVTDRQLACMTATPGKWDRATDGQLQVQLLYQGDRDIQPFRLKGSGSEIASGWHATQIAAGDDVTPLLDAIRVALGSGR